MANEGWISDLHEADAIIVSTHSQGSIVSTHLLNRLIQDGHIATAQNHDSTSLEQVLRHFHPRLECLKRPQVEKARYNGYVVRRLVGSILGLLSI